MKFLLPRLICASPLRSPTRAEEITLAQILKSAACRTGHFGRGLEDRLILQRSPGGPSQMGNPADRAGVKHEHLLQMRAVAGSRVAP
jgi:hypothetical protein